MMEDINYELEYLGFSKNEVRVYLTLLRVGRSQAGRLAKEARLERTSTYNALKKLIEMGLVSYVIEANKKIFCASDPEKIIDLFKEKQERASLILPKLKNIKEFEREKEDILKFTGYSGIKTVFNDILKSTKPKERYLMIGAEGQLSEKLPVFAEIHVARKDEKKLSARLLTRKGIAGKKMSKYTKIRYFPKEMSSKISMTIYGDKVALIIWSDNPEAIIIDNKEAAYTFRNYFEFMWKYAKEK